MQIRDRIQGLRRVKASELIPNAKNWRLHPDSQKNALRGILAEVGYVDALLARELPDGTLQLLDGHLRAETTPDAEVPVLIVDLDESEADKVLATFDPLSAMAKTDADQLDVLLRGIETENDDLRELLEKLAEDAGLIPEEESGRAPEQSIPGEYHVIVECAGESQQKELLARFSQEGLKCRALIV